MKKIEITIEAFTALEKDAQIDYLNKIRIELGNENVVFKFGDNIIRDREELQTWQIKNEIL
jgi:hypothetical protein